MRSRSPNKRNVGSCWFKVCATSPNNTQQHATTRNNTCNNTQQHVKGCANRRNKSDIQQSWELFGPTLLRPFKRGLRAAEKHEGRICLKRGYFMQVTTIQSLLMKEFQFHRITLSSGTLFNHLMLTNIVLSCSYLTLMKVIDIT